MNHQNSIGLHPSVKNVPKKVPRGCLKIFQDENDRFLTSCLWNDTKAVRFVSTCSDPTLKIQMCRFSGLLLLKVLPGKKILAPVEVPIQFLSSGFNCKCLHIVHFYKQNLKAKELHTVRI